MRLIDADALKKAIIKRLGIKSGKYLLESERSIYNCIDEQPTIELLKAQQPRKAIYKTNPWTNLPVSFCPNCEEAIKMYEYGHGFAKRKYCSYCGQAIDWGDGEQE